MKKIIVFFISLICLFITVIYLYFENNTLELSYYEVSSKMIPKDFDDYKIIQISDFHNTNSKRLIYDLVDNIKKEKPNIIIITGDLIDSRNTDVNVTINFIEKIKDVSPIYYVTGNHEARTNEYVLLKDELLNLKIRVLENEFIQLQNNGSSIDLIGINDPSFYIKDSNKEAEILNESINNFNISGNNFTILLTHRPELFDIYVDNDINLVFTGHAHGGQIVLPFIGPLFVPNQGIFPKYTEGMHESNNTKMIISRGIGNSIFPFRINNNPELVIVTLKNIK